MTMTNRLFNSPYEMQLRLSLLLSRISFPISLDKLVALDFITVYGAEFNVSAENLHGDSMFRFSEIASKREQAQEAIRRMAKMGIIEIQITNGYEYSLSSAGKKYANSFEGMYASKYRKNAEKAVKEYSQYSDQELMKMIQNKSMEGR